MTPTQIIKLLTIILKIQTNLTHRVEKNLKIHLQKVKISPLFTLKLTSGLKKLLFDVTTVSQYLLKFNLLGIKTYL